MSWTGSVVSVEKQQENPINIKVTVEFSNSDTDEKIRRFALAVDASDEFVAQFTKANIAQLETRDTHLAALTKQGPIDVSIAPGATDREKFSAAMNDLLRLKQHIDLGILQADSKEYTDAVALAKSLRQPGF